LGGVFGASGAGLEGIWKEIVLRPVPAASHPWEGRGTKPTPLP